MGIYINPKTQFFDILRKNDFFFHFFIEIYTIYCISVIGIGIGRYGKIYISNLSVSADWIYRQLSVSADTEKSLSIVHWFER